MGCRSFFAVLTLSVLGCSSVSQTRVPSSLSVQKPHTLVVFVHGFGGDAMIESSIQRHQGKGKEAELRASVGEFNAIYDNLKQSAESKGLPITFAAFKYDTKTYSNIPAARILNLMLLERVPKNIEEPFNNSLPFDVNYSLPIDKVVFITLSNGNLVLREAILQAFGKVDPEYAPHGKKFTKLMKDSPSKGVPLEEMMDIRENSELIDIYRRSSIYDISPILGGAADARGAPDLIRFGQLDPTGDHNRWLFSSENVQIYNESVQNRHYTYLVCGDPYTRGIWHFFSGVRKNPKWNSLGWVSEWLTGDKWITNNYRWFIHYERARGVDAEHHFEFFPDFLADPYCNYKETTKNMKAFIESRSSRRILNRPKDSLFRAHFADRVSRFEQGYFAHPMPPRIEDFDFKKLEQVHLAGSKYYDLLMQGFKNKSPEEYTLEERHTVLVYYKPLIEMLNRSVFEARH